ncbi:hypothetical protein D3C77_433710 [compost metagenome]
MTGSSTAQRHDQAHRAVAGPLECYRRRYAYPFARAATCDAVPGTVATPGPDQDARWRQVSRPPAFAVQPQRCRSYPVVGTRTATARSVAIPVHPPAVQSAEWRKSSCRRAERSDRPAPPVQHPSVRTTLVQSSPAAGARERLRQAQAAFQGSAHNNPGCRRPFACDKPSAATYRWRSWARRRD